MLFNRYVFVKLDHIPLLACKYTIFILCLIFVSGCNSIIGLTKKPTLMPTQINYPNAPEPQGPIIKGIISGLPGGKLATITARLDSATGGGIYGLRGNGPWEMEIIYDENAQRKVIAQADEYFVQPDEYVIYFKEAKALLIQDGVRTDLEATNLDFVFSAVSNLATLRAKDFAFLPLSERLTTRISMGHSFIEPKRLYAARVSVISPNLLRPSNG